MQESIQVSDSLIIGTGRDRVCYEHPIKPELCIKIAKKREKQTRREILYQWILSIRGVDLSLISQYQYMCETNVGKGAVFELIRNENGDVSETLTQAIKNHTLTREQVSELTQNLKDYLTQNAICVRDLSPNNIVVQKLAGSTKPIIIDGVSNPTSNPLVLLTPYLARRSLKKSWASMQNKINKLHLKYSDENS